MFDFLGPVTVYVNDETTLRRIIREEIHTLEELMATEAEQITALDTKVTDLISDVRAALAALEADRDNLGPDGQAALDTLTAKIDAFDTEVGDADGSDTPPPPTV
jgi:uncharacterized coiled-coil protein SlyX